MKSPIFLISLPRSGSTLLQRLLLAHEQIGGTAEPWLLLPFVYSTRESGIYTEYGHATCYKAFEDFIQTLSDREEIYLSYLADFAFRLYRNQLKNDEIYFLDKTPRYYLILPEIAKMFPDAKFIFLFRNPLEILSSNINTWNKGRLRIITNQIDLMRGPQKMSEGWEILQDRAMRIQYEELVIDTDTVLKKLFSFLELDYNPDIVKNFSHIKLSGRMGDKVGSTEYKAIERSTLNKWKKTLNTKRRVSYAKKYLNKISPKTLEMHGYKYDKLISQLNSLKPAKWGYIVDNFDLLTGWLLVLIEYKQMVNKNKINDVFLHY